MRLFPDCMRWPEPAAATWSSVPSHNGLSFPTSERAFVPPHRPAGV